LAQGASLCAVGLLVGLTLLVVTPRVKLFPVNALLVLAAWFCFWFFSHDLAHHIIGRIFGVGFRYYFLGRSTITRLSLPIASNLLRMVPVLGLKIDKSSLKSASPNKARAMYASGAISSMFLPWFRNSYRILGWSSGWNLAHNSDDSKRCLYSLLQPPSRRPSSCSNGQKLGRIVHHDTF